MIMMNKTCTLFLGHRASFLHQSTSQWKKIVMCFCWGNNEVNFRTGLQKYVITATLYLMLFFTEIIMCPSHLRSIYDPAIRILTRKFLYCLYLMLTPSTWKTMRSSCSHATVVWQTILKPSQWLINVSDATFGMALHTSQLPLQFCILSHKSVY